KLGLDSRKRVRIYYQIPISVVAQGVKYGCLAIEGDDDLQIVFHCRRQFLEVRTTELFLEVADSLASFGGSAPHPRPVNAGGPSGSRHQTEIDALQVASPSFDFNLQPEAAIGGTELGDYRCYSKSAIIHSIYKRKFNTTKKIFYLVANGHLN
ncbi:hypothetical protein PIB30_092964, partial [Stylosanthes scabra]|nr:hypothetical protein [Stylosanthes scabra]